MRIDFKEFRPVLAPILRKRAIALTISGIALLQMALTLHGLAGWQCPILYATNILCPGCGLSRAIAALLRGSWGTALTYHAFAPLCVIALIIIGGTALLPEDYWHTFIEKLDVIERSTAISLIMLIGLILYWVARLMFTFADFIRLISA